VIIAGSSVSELEVIREWYAYNARSRQGYLDCFAKLPRDEFLRDRGASYPSMLRIFEHTMGAYYYWLNMASSDNPRLPRFGPLEDWSENPSVAELADAERRLQDIMYKFLESLTEGDLELTFVRKGKDSARDQVLTVREMLWHLVEEDLQHRGELNALLWQIDVDPPIFNWIEWSKLRKEQPQPEARPAPHSS